METVSKSGGGNVSEHAPCLHIRAPPFEVKLPEADGVRPSYRLWPPKILQHNAIKKTEPGVLIALSSIIIAL